MLRRGGFPPWPLPQGVTGTSQEAARVNHLNNGSYLDFLIMKEELYTGPYLKEDLTGSFRVHLDIILSLGSFHPPVEEAFWGRSHASVRPSGAPVTSRRHWAGLRERPFALGQTRGCVPREGTAVPEAYRGPAGATPRSRGRQCGGRGGHSGPFLVPTCGQKDRGSKCFFEASGNSYLGILNAGRSSNGVPRRTQREGRPREGERGSPRP